LFAFTTCKEKVGKILNTGEDRDAHGCIGSAGYQWSELQQDCIRVFELPIQLVSPSQEQIAGLIFSEKMDQVEVFYAEASLVLEQTKLNLYQLKQGEIVYQIEKKNEKWVFFTSTQPDYIYTQE
jgi:hypothetical protein